MRARRKEAAMVDRNTCEKAIGLIKDGGERGRFKCSPPRVVVDAKVYASAASERKTALETDKSTLNCESA